jgi:hypothetical protein
VRNGIRDESRLGSNVMRRLVGSWFVAVMIALLSPLAASASPAVPTAAASAVEQAAAAPVAVSVKQTGFRDEAAMVLIGTALIALAGAVRRTA